MGNSFRLHVILQHFLFQDSDVLLVKGDVLFILVVRFDAVSKSSDLTLQYLLSVFYNLFINYFLRNTSQFLCFWVADLSYTSKHRFEEFCGHDLRGSLVDSLDPGMYFNRIMNHIYQSCRGCACLPSTTVHVGETGVQSKFSSTYIRLLVN